MQDQDEDLNRTSTPPPKPTGRFPTLREIWPHIRERDVGGLLDCATQNLRPTVPEHLSGENKELLNQLIQGKRTDGTGPSAALILGRLELLWFLTTFLLLFLSVIQPGAAAPLIGVWFAFKVASGWESLSTVAKIPEQPPPGISQILWIVFLRQLAAHTNYRAIIGPLINLLAALLFSLLVVGGVNLFRLLLSFFHGG
jgi:hypothetical protein